MFNSKFWIRDEITKGALMRSYQITMSRAKGAQQEMVTNISWKKIIDTLLHLKYYSKKVRKRKALKHMDKR